MQVVCSPHTGLLPCRPGASTAHLKEKREEMEGLLASSPQEKWARWPFCWTEGLPSVRVPFLCP